MQPPVSFPSTTPRLSLPLLFAGQAQKEFFLNQAFSVIDAQASGTCLASLSTPPADPVEGACYRITAPASEEWTGHEDQLALRIAQSWHYIEPADGMRVFDRTAGVLLVFGTQWRSAEAPALPQAGSTIDTEARETIASLIEELRKIGIFAD